jgi:hypothetical protein
MLQSAYGEMLKKFGDEMGIDGTKVADYLMVRYATTTKGQAPEPLNLKNLNITMDQLTELETRALKEISKHHNAVMALEGTLGYDIDPTLRQLSAMAMVYQNFRVLIPTLFSSMSDPLGIAVRGGDLDDAFKAMKIGFKEVVKRWKGDESVEKGSLMDLAEMIGTVDAGTFMESLGQTYSSLYMSGKTKRANDFLFKWNGMEAWNRGMRAGATQAAVKFIKRHIETPNKDSERYLKELFPDGVNPTLKDGELDFMDPKVFSVVPLK